MPLSVPVMSLWKANSWLSRRYNDTQEQTQISSIPIPPASCVFPRVAGTRPRPQAARGSLISVRSTAREGSSFAARWCFVVAASSSATPKAVSVAPIPLLRGKRRQIASSSCLLVGGAPTTSCLLASAISKDARLVLLIRFPECAFITYASFCSTKWTTKIQTPFFPFASRLLLSATSSG